MSKAMADKWFSWSVRCSAGWKCQRCGKQFEPPTTQLQCSHLFSRKHNITRWHPNNAFAHCASCHAWLESRPPEFAAWATDFLGTERYESLRKYHNRITKLSKSDFKVIADHYRAEYDRMSEAEYGFYAEHKLANHPLAEEE